MVLCELRGIWLNLSSHWSSSSLRTVMLTLAYPQAYTKWGLGSAHTHIHMSLACFAFTHLGLIKIHHIQGFDMYQMPV